jgi:hypothetical protein
MVEVIHLLFGLKMICKHPKISCGSFWRGAFGSQTLQLTMTVYAVTTDPIISPIIVILFGCGIYAFTVLEIFIDIVIEIVPDRWRRRSYPRGIGMDSV